MQIDTVKISPTVPATDVLLALPSAIVESSRDAIIGETLDGTITSWNAAAEQMFGYTAEEVIGQSIRLIIPPELQAQEDDVLAQIARGEQIERFETVRIAKDGRRVTVALTVSPIRNIDGAIVGASKIARDITERRHQDALLAAIVSSSDDAIVSKTLEGIITSWNPAAERMFGYTAAEAVGQSIRMIIPADRQAEEDYVLGLIRRGEKVDHFETIRHTKDGRLLNISITVSPVRDVGGVIVGASKIARDITYRKALEREREEALQKMGQALASRDEFIAIAAHELRNPLNVLTLLWRILERTKSFTGTPEGNLIAKARVQLARLISLVDRLLDVTRIRAGTFDLFRENLDLSALVREVTNRFVIENPSLSIRLDFPPTIIGTWDRLRLDQVVTNLVSNAVKYGMQKPIEVSAVVDGGHAVIAVKDHGKGIAPLDLARIFERFERVEEGTSEDGGRSHHDGLGMGLWITKEIVQAHGGTILAESELGTGSKFVVRIPVEQPVAIKALINERLWNGPR